MLMKRASLDDLSYGCLCFLPRKMQPCIRRGVEPNDGCVDGWLVLLFVSVLVEINDTRVCRVS